MRQQNYNNHIFYYWPHHFFFYGAVLAGFVLCALGFFYYPQDRLIWAMMAFVIVLVVWLAFMSRQHYALGNQDRIVRLEMRLRYYILTGKRFEDIEAQLSFGAVAALRFAPDDELAALIGAAIAEKLSGDEIKRRIKNWLPDTKRV